MQKYRIWLVLAFLAILGSATGKAQSGGAPRPDGWVTFSPENGGFRMTLPAEPTGSVETMSEISQNMKVAYYTSMGGGLLIVVGDLYNLPRPAGQFSESERRSIYTNFRDGLSQGMVTTLAGKGLNLKTSYSEQKNVTLRGLEGFEQTMTVGHYSGRARMLVAGEHIFIFCAVAFNDAAAKHVGASLDSFEEIGRRRSTPTALRDVAVLSQRPF
jgi:hypothetical protein